MGRIRQLGWLIVADASDCTADLNDKVGLELLCIRAIHECGLRPYEHFVKTFPEIAWGEEGGTSAVMLMIPLHESHLCVHTWSKLRRVCLDLFTCGDRDKAQRAAERVIGTFTPGNVRWRVYPRGGEVHGN